MAYKFFDSLNQDAQEEKFHGRPLIRQNSFLSPKTMIIIEFIFSILFIAMINLIALGLLVLLHTPIRELILGN